MKVLVKWILYILLWSVYPAAMVREMAVTWMPFINWLELDATKDIK
jgi:hypothetical protein